MISRIKLFAAAIAAASTVSVSGAQAQLEPGDPGHLTWLYSHTRASVLDTVLQASEFSVARAAEDQAAMEINAAELLSALTEARAWTGALDRTITPGEFTPEIDAAVVDLAALADGAYNNVADALMSDDMEEIGRRLDESSPTFNRLSADLNALRPLLLEYL